MKSSELVWVTGCPLTLAVKVRTCRSLRSIPAVTPSTLAVATLMTIVPSAEKLPLSASPKSVPWLTLGGETFPNLNAAVPAPVARMAT